MYAFLTTVPSMLPVLHTTCVHNTNNGPSPPNQEGGRRGEGDTQDIHGRSCKIGRILYCKERIQELREGTHAAVNCWAGSCRAGRRVTRTCRLVGGLECVAAREDGEKVTNSSAEGVLVYDSKQFKRAASQGRE